MPARGEERRRPTPTQRKALVVFALTNGEGLAVRDVMRMTGLGKRGAEKFLELLSGVLPIYRDEDDVWQICFSQEIKNVR